MSNERGDVDPFQSAVAQVSAEVPSDSDAVSSDVQDPFQSAVASGQPSEAVPSDSGAASGEVDPFQAPS